ncbi:hypothetical protein OROGR_029048 [Orobanche gracilis]
MVVRRDWSRVDADDDRDFLGWNGFSAIWVSSPGSNLEHIQFDGFQEICRQLLWMESKGIVI